MTNISTRPYPQILFVLFITALLGGCASTPELAELEKPVFPPEPAEPRIHFQQSIFSSADIEIEDKDSTFRRMITGESRKGVGMAKPFGVTVHQGRLFVSDTVRRLVSVFDKQENKYFEIGTKRPGELVMPMGLDVDNKGNLYVIDASLKQVNVYDRDGTYLRTVGRREEFSRPSSVTVDPEGTRIFVVDTGGVSSTWHRVVVFDSQSGDFLYNISTRGSGDGELNLPREATIAPNGNLYVVDGGNFRIQAFTQEGEFLHSFGDIGRRSGQFSRPKGIGVDNDNNIYVVDAAFGNFQIFNEQGQLLLPIGFRSSLNGPANFMLPAGLDVDEDGRIYMVDQYFRKVDVFRPANLAEHEGYFGIPE